MKNREPERLPYAFHGFAPVALPPAFRAHPWARAPGLRGAISNVGFPKAREGRAILGSLRVSPPPAGALALALALGSGRLVANRRLGAFSLRPPAGPPRASGGRSVGKVGAAGGRRAVHGLCLLCPRVAKHRPRLEPARNPRVRARARVSPRPQVPGQLCRSSPAALARLLAVALRAVWQGRMGWASARRPP